mgnify:CR=1 FL=1
MEASMGCGCNKKGVVRRTPSVRSSSAPQAVKGGASAGPTPIELRAMGLQKSQSLTDSRAADSQRRRVEKLRRDAIKKKLGH